MKRSYWSKVIPSPEGTIKEIYRRGIDWIVVKVDRGPIEVSFFFNFLRREGGRARERERERERERATKMKSEDSGLSLPYYYNKAGLRNALLAYIMHFQTSNEIQFNYTFKDLTKEAGNSVYTRSRINAKRRI